VVLGGGRFDVRKVPLYCFVMSSGFTEPRYPCMGVLGVFLREVPLYVRSYMLIITTPTP